jgi:hypothetical protein
MKKNQTYIIFGYIVIFLYLMLIFLPIDNTLAFQVHKIEENNQIFNKSMDENKTDIEIKDEVKEKCSPCPPGAQCFC